MEKSPEVLIYLQTVKKYIDGNEEAKKYFIANDSESDFFDLIGDISQINFEKRGQPELSKEQFELVRITLIAFKKSEEEIPDDSIYEYIPNHINFYLK
jgi:Golgi nucleoside diphosphatase